MRELYSRALVLERRDSGEVDGMISLFTEDFGKITAFAKSIRKPTSKLSAHLQPLTFIKMRFIQRPGPRDGWSIVDCLRDDDFVGYKTNQRYDLLDIISFLNNYLFESQTDRKLWEYIKHLFVGQYNKKEMSLGLVKIIGFDAFGAACAGCGNKKLSAFVGDQQIFLCSRCALKINSNNVLLLDKLVD